MDSITEIKHCRLCGGNIDIVLDFGITARANSFLNKEDLDKPEFTAPLQCCLCQDCGSFQIKHDVNPEILFKNYLYESSTSLTFVNHFREYAKYITNRLNLQKEDYILEIGSNDNILLNRFKELGYVNLYGVEPAQNLVDLYGKNYGDNIVCDFFTENIVNTRLSHLISKVSLISAHNIFAHNPNLQEIVKGINLLLNDNGVFVFEVTYLKSNIEKGLFDMQYLEHVFTHSVKPMDIFFKSLGMEIFDVEIVNTHGGSIRCFVKKENGNQTISQSVNKFIQDEEYFGLYKAEIYKLFWDDIQTKKHTLLIKLGRIKEKNEKVWVYGAPAKLTTFFNVMGLNKDLIERVVDDSPQKQGKFTPQHHIPVVCSSNLIKEQPEYCLILAWNFADSIMQNNKNYKGNWINPF